MAKKKKKVNTQRIFALILLIGMVAMIISSFFLI